MRKGNFESLKLKVDSINAKEQKGLFTSLVDRFEASSLVKFFSVISVFMVIASAYAFYQQVVDSRYVKIQKLWENLENNKTKRAAMDSLTSLSELGIGLYAYELDGNDYGGTLSLRGIDLEGSDFGNAYIRNVDFIDCSIKNSSFLNASLHNVRFLKCDSRNVDFRNVNKYGFLDERGGSDSEKVYFIGSRLNSSDFSGARLELLTMSYSEVNDVRFENAEIKKMWVVGSDLNGSIMDLRGNYDLLYDNETKWGVGERNAKFSVRGAQLIDVRNTALSKEVAGMKVWSLVQKVAARVSDKYKEIKGFEGKNTPCNLLDGHCGSESLGDVGLNDLDLELNDEMRSLLIRSDYRDSEIFSALMPWRSGYLAKWGASFFSMGGFFYTITKCVGRSMKYSGRRFALHDKYCSQLKYDG